MKLNLKNILIALVIFLLAANVSTIFTYRNHLEKEQLLAEKKLEIPETQMGRYFRDELNLNSEQMDQFREFRRKYNRTANSMLGDMQALRNKMAQELNSKKPNRLKLDELAGSLGLFHTELKGLTFDYYFNMQSVLDEEQQNKMIDIFQAMLTEQGFAKTPDHTNHNNGEHIGNGRGRQRQVDESAVEDNEFYKFQEN